MPVYFIDDAIRLLSNRGDAADLGCGAGVDAKYLAENGFRVTAIDRDESAVRSTKSLCRGLPVKVEALDLREVQLTSESLDLAIAWNSLPFVGRKNFNRVMGMILKALVPGGLLIFSLFGPDDAWSKTKADLAFVNRESLKHLMIGTSFIEVRESWRSEPDASGKLKAWHLIQGITRKSE